MRSEQSDEQSAEQLQEVTHPKARITHRGICASPDTIFGSHNRTQRRWRTSTRCLSGCMRMPVNSGLIPPASAIKGESGGGGFAAGAALYARDRQGPKFRLSAPNL